MSRTLSTAALALVALLAGQSAAQPAPQDPPAEEVPEPAPTISALRAFLEQIDRVLVTRRRPLPSVPTESGGSVQVSGIGAFEPGLESQRLLGLRFDVEGPGLEPEERTTYLDLHEVDALLRGMAHLALLAEEGGRGLETEARIRMLEGIGLGVWMHQGTLRYQLRAGSDGRVIGHLSPENFAKLQSHIEKARDRLFNAAN